MPTKKELSLDAPAQPRPQPPKSTQEGGLIAFQVGRFRVKTTCAQPADRDLDKPTRSHQANMCARAVSYRSPYSTKANTIYIVQIMSIRDISARKDLDHDLRN